MAGTYRPPGNCAVSSCTIFETTMRVGAKKKVPLTRRGIKRTSSSVRNRKENDAVPVPDEQVYIRC